MDIRDHAAHTKELFDLSAEDIHKWIDGYFDNQGFQSFLQGEPSPRFNPYAHRRHRHCREALEEALEEFRHLYSPRQIEQIFFQHLKDDYDDYIPSREDFDRDDFLQKYHHNPRQETVRQEPILSSEERDRYFIYDADTARKKTGNSGFLIRIVLPSLISAGLFLIFIFYFIVPSIEDVMINGKREMIRELANAAASVIDYYIELEQQGVMTLEEAQQEALSELEKMRYGIMGKDYYWIIDHQPVMIMHTYRPELVGQDLSNYRDREDKSGKFLFQEAVKLVEAQGEGYLRYQWQWMDDPDSSAEKMSYVMSIEPWGWILGTGVYIHDVQLELEEIQGRLVHLSLLLSGGILLLLLVMVFQSRKIENSRRKAEQGLVEAKERYRSLVERSNEAYLLILDNKIVFANQRMLQMLDARDEEIGRSTLEELMERIEPEEERKTLLKLIKEGKEPGKERSLRLSSKKGATLLVTLHLSRVFFQDSNGYLMSIKEIPPFQAVVMKPQGVLPGISVETLIEEIRGSATHNYALFRLQTLSGILYQKEKKNSPWEMRRDISRVYHALEEQVLNQIQQELGAPPTDFALLNLGSNARGEMTLYSDQDNALILEHADESIPYEWQEYFRELTSRFCAVLNQAGFSYCPGGIMAVNPPWRMTLSAWKKSIRQWVQRSEFKDIMYMNVLADMEFVAGKNVLYQELQQEIQIQMKESPAFINRFAGYCLEQPLPLNGIGQLLPETKEGRKIIHTKNCLKVLEGSARVLAVEEQISDLGTAERFRSSTLHPHTVEDAVSAFDSLWRFRFKTQTAAYQGIRRVDDQLDMQTLEQEEIKELTQAIQNTRLVQKALKFRYFGREV